MQNNHKQWFIGKSPDTYCPMGPAVITKDEINNIDVVKLQTFVNEEERQVGIVKDMVFTIPILIGNVNQIYDIGRRRYYSNWNTSWGWYWF